MKRKFNYLDGIITVDTDNGKTTVTMTDADGTVSNLDEIADPGDLTEAQREAIGNRFGQPKRNGQPF